MIFAMSGKIRTEKKGDTAAFRLSGAELLYLAFCFLLYFCWSLAKELNYGPDEAMRYLIPEYIYRTGSLPNGYMEELRNDLWGFSYAFYPNFLGPLASALCMKVVSFVTADAFALVAAARFPSVLAASGTVYLSMKIGKRVFPAEGVWLYVVSLSMIPQFVFLSSYVNNDMLCIFGSALMLYAWVLGIQEQWNGKNGLLLAAGIVVAALSYYNSYGWILCSMVIFAGSYIWKIGGNRDWRRMVRIGFLIAAVVLMCIGYFFIRNAVLYDGDFLGMRALGQSADRYAAEEWRPVNRSTPQSEGMSVVEMLVSGAWTGTPWIVKTYVTFIGAFGFADVFLPLWMYGVYTLVFAAAFAGVVGKLSGYVKAVRAGERPRDRAAALLHVMLFFAMVIPVGLSIFYSYTSDYQAQGRYCYPMILAFCWFETEGLLWLMDWRRLAGKGRRMAAGVYCGMVIALTLAVTATVYL